MLLPKGNAGPAPLTKMAGRCTALNSIRRCELATKVVYTKPNHIEYT